MFAILSMRHHDKRPHENKRPFFIYRLENHASLSYPFKPKWFVHPTCNITSKAKSYSIINDSNFEILFYFFSDLLTKKWKMIRIESRFALKSGRQCGNTLDKCAAWNIHEFWKTFILSLFYPSRSLFSPSPSFIFSFLSSRLHVLKKYTDTSNNCCFKSMYYKLLHQQEEKKSSWNVLEKCGNLSKYLRINFHYLIDLCALKLNHFLPSVLFQVNHIRFKSSNIPKNHRTSTSRDMYSWSENMDFIRGQKFKWSMVQCCQENLSLFPRRCTEDLWRKLTLSFMRKWVNKFRVQFIDSVFFLHVNFDSFCGRRWTIWGSSMRYEFWFENFFVRLR